MSQTSGVLHVFQLIHIIITQYWSISGALSTDWLEFLSKLILKYHGKSTKLKLLRKRPIYEKTETKIWFCRIPRREEYGGKEEEEA